MTCASYAHRIEKELSRSPGVRRAGVNLASSGATVEYDPDRIGVRQLMDTARAAGYGTARTGRTHFVVG